MISIRLSKIGKKNRPAYRIVVVPKRSGRNGRAIEILGSFNPHQKEAKQINEARLKYWQSQGAEVSPAVTQILEQKYQFKKYVPAQSRPGA